MSDAAFISANQQFDLKHYGPFERREATFIYAALADDAFRFDASDLMPPPIGDDLFWASMMRYATEGPGESRPDPLRARRRLARRRMSRFTLLAESGPVSLDLTLFGTRRRSWSRRSP